MFDRSDVVRPISDKSNLVKSNPLKAPFEFSKISDCISKVVADLAVIARGDLSHD